MLFEKRSTETWNVSQVPPGSIVKGWGQETYAEKTVTVEGSLAVTAVLAGLTILMEDIASLPLILYRRLPRGKERATDRPYYRLMHDAPNPEHTSMVFRELIVGHLVGWGNFYGQLIWNGAGVVEQIWPLRPDRMRVFREGGVRKYLYTKQDGSQRAFREDEILHIPAFGFDGLVGYSRISLARNAIGLSMAAEEYGSKTFANGARPSAVLTSPKPMTPDVQKRLKESWEEHYRGTANAGKTAVLEDGLDIKTIGFPPQDAQFLETRQFQVAEIARIFRIPPHMIGDVQKSTSWGTGIEQQELAYVAHTLRPWMTRIEKQLNKDLLLEGERETYFFEHLVDDLLRGDTQSRFTAYSTAITNGILSRNEVREMENRNPYDGGDDYIMPLNMAPTSEPPADDTPPADADEPDEDEMPMPQKKAADPQVLLRDAAERIVRRELHDVGDALKRWGEKKPEKFAEWQTAFFRQDHPEFIVQQLTPFITAGYLTEAVVQSAARAYSDERAGAPPAEIAPGDHELLTEHLLTLLEEVEHA